MCAIKLLAKKFTDTGLFCCVLLALVVVGPELANAQAAASASQPGFGEVFSRMLPMFAIVFMIYYFMIAKPQQIKVQAQKDLMASLKKGDSVVTTGGIFGRVSGIEADTLMIEIAPNVKIKVELSQIARKDEPARSKSGEAKSGEERAA